MKTTQNKTNPIQTVGAFGKTPLLAITLAFALIGCSGADGVNGTNGEDGTSCSIKEADNSNDFAVYCGNEFIGYLNNGEDGKDGSSSSNGTVNSSSSKGNSIVSGTVSYGGQTYKTVKIGTQTWMAENLNYETESGSWCYGNEVSKCETYGRLYNWATAMNLPEKCNDLLSTEDTDCQVNTSHQGICPTGYHIPTNADWDKLLRFVDVDAGYMVGANYYNAVAGKHLKAEESWAGCSLGDEDYECYDTYGFSALLGGMRSGTDSFAYVSYFGEWWLANESDEIKKYSRYFNIGIGESTYSSNNPKSYGLSIRCVKD